MTSTLCPIALCVRSVKKPAKIAADFFKSCQGFMPCSFSLVSTMVSDAIEWDIRTPAREAFVHELSLSKCYVLRLAAAESVALSLEDRNRLLQDPVANMRHAVLSSYGTFQECFTENEEILEQQARFFLAFVKEGDDGKPVLDEDKPVLPIKNPPRFPKDSIEKPTKQTMPLYLALAQYGSSDAKSELASWEGITSKLIEVLKKTSDRDVRMALLGNSDARLSEDDIRTLLNGDPEMAVDLLDGWCSDAVKSFIKKAFADTEDPAVADAIARAQSSEDEGCDDDDGYEDDEEENEDD